MIGLDIRCDVCSESDWMPLGTKLRDIYKLMHHIKGKDYCSNCVTKALNGLGYIKHDENLILRDLTKKEKIKVVEYYKNDI